MSARFEELAYSPSPIGEVSLRRRRDPRTGEPSGTLREDAVVLVSRIVPPRSDAELAAGLERAQKLANQFGITTVFSAATDEAELRGGDAERARKYTTEQGRGSRAKAMLRLSSAPAGKLDDTAAGDGMWARVRCVGRQRERWTTVSALVRGHQKRRIARTA